MVAQLDATHVEGSGPEALGFRRHVVRRNEEEFRFVVDETLDEPGTGDAVDLHRVTGTGDIPGLVSTLGSEGLHAA